MKAGVLQRFKEAMLAREVRSLMPTDMSSAELEQLGADVLERGVFSARTMSAKYLEAMERAVRGILEPKTQPRMDANGRESFFTEGTDQPSARLELKKVWEALGYVAPEGKEGTIEDLSSDRRIDLVIETNVDMARGFGQWRQGQEPEILDLWPCSELFRAEDREEPRDWGKLWEAAVAVGDYEALRCWQEHGRMIARKDSAIWMEISDFGTPYPPFKFNSGMWTRDVERETAVALGVIGEWDRVAPQRRAFELEAQAA